MSRQSKKDKRNKDKFDDEGDSGRLLKEETVRAIVAVMFFVVSIFLMLSAFDKAGWVGVKAFENLSFLFGVGFYILPILFIILSVSFFRTLHKKLALTHSVGGLLFFASTLSLINISMPENGGIVGILISNPLLNLFDKYASVVILVAFSVISLIVIFDAPLRFNFIRALFKKKEPIEGEDTEPELIIANADQLGITPKDLKAMDSIPREVSVTPKKEDEPKKDEFGISPLLWNGKEFTPPPLSLLSQDKGKPGVGDIKSNSNIIKRTLQNFGINVEMDEISIGPSITRYALKPAEGVKLSRILGLQNDLALALAAHPIRIEAPIPGKSLVGIEIPNSTKTTVGLGPLLASNEFQNSDKPLLMSLGKGTSGLSFYANLAKSPHLLIAGTTGSGKSITIHALITSLLYRNSPENMKFIMVDPKRVELTLYNKIPHLLTPVITDAKKTILALKWAAKEMDRRYEILQANSLQNISSYHKNVLEPELKKRNGRKSEDDKPIETMPYIVIVIDELADIMQAYPRELESAIVRLAQMSRAVGIHLIVSTQRPSVNVITGLIKANIPSRIALQVASQIDSRTILDMPGAEKLLGAGDMLYLSGEMSQPQRIQSAFISENEVKDIVKFLAQGYEDEVPNDINLDPNSGSGSKNSIFEATLDDERSNDEDELYEEAKQTVIEAGKASTSYLQRKLGIGYARAARLIDILEERGVVGPGSGAKPREVFGASSTTGTSEDSQHPV